MPISKILYFLRIWPFREFESELSNECRIDTTFMYHHDFRKCRVPVNTTLDRNYIILNDLVPNGNQFYAKPVGKTPSVVVSFVECSFGSVKLFSTTGSGVHSQDLFSLPPNVGSNTIWYLNCIQRKI